MSGTDITLGLDVSNCQQWDRSHGPMGAGQSRALTGNGSCPLRRAGVRPDHRRRDRGRAGLTERTFFRHFADKREVLFGGAGLLEERILAGVIGAPPAAGPLEAMSQGLDSAAEMLGETRRDLACHRQAVIAANPELHERELAKLAHYAAVITTALRDRGVSEQPAKLTAETGMTVLRLAMQQWATGTDKRELAAIMRNLRRRPPGPRD